MVLAFQKNNSVGIEKDKLDKRETGGGETSYSGFAQI